MTILKVTIMQRTAHRQGFVILKLDVQRAFDSVLHMAIMAALRNTLSINGSQNGSFRMHRGIPQRLISAVLFNLVMDYFISDARTARTHSDLPFDHALYMDDLFLLAPSWEAAKECVDSVASSINKAELPRSTKRACGSILKKRHRWHPKTYCKTPLPWLLAGNSAGPIVFSFWGWTYQPDGTGAEDLPRRIGKATKFFWVWKKHSLQPQPWFCQEIVISQSCCYSFNVVGIRVHTALAF